jgi:hypothetical protein
MVTLLLVLGALLGPGVAAVTFVLNSSTSIQLGPVPFFGGAILFIVCLIAAIARHVVWH